MVHVSTCTSRPRLETAPDLLHWTFDQKGSRAVRRVVGSPPPGIVRSTGLTLRAFTDGDARIALDNARLRTVATELI